MAHKKSTNMHLSLGALPEVPPMVEPVAPPVPEMPTLTMAEMRELEAQAREEVNKELKAKLRADFLAKTKSEMKKKTLFVQGSDEQGVSLERIQLDLPKFSDRITLDGVIYFHGVTYNFAPAKAAVIKETMHRQWMHHAEINGLDMNDFLGRKPQNSVLTPKQL